MLGASHTRIVLSVAVIALAVAPTATATRLSANERALLGAVNEARAAHDLRPLQVDPKLVRAARAHSATLLREDVFTHGSFAARIARSGARGPAFGENLAWGTGGDASAKSIVRSWLVSPGHRANLLRPGWTRIGLGARVGTFLGVEAATVVTAAFAGS